MSDKIIPKDFSQVYETFKPGLVGGTTEHLRGDAETGVLYLHGPLSISGSGDSALAERKEKWQNGATIVRDTIDHEFGNGIGDRVLRKVSIDVGRDITKELYRGDLPLIRTAIAEDRAALLMVPMPNGAMMAWTPSLQSVGPELAGKAMDDAGALKGIERQVQQKINDGATVAQTLVNLAGPMLLTEKNVSDLMWYLQARGELKTGTNNAPDITYTLPDPHGHILRSFDQTVSATQGSLAYQRDSSHLTGFQKADQGNAPRGVNMIPQNGSDYDRLLPHENQTVLYQKMSQNVNGYPEDRIFIKPESHGMFYSKPDKPDPTGPQRNALPGDKTHSIGHSLSFFESTARKLSGNNSPEGSFKERVPPELGSDYKALVAKAPPQLRNLLLQHNPTGDSSGLHVMLENIRQANSQPGYVDLGFARAVTDFTQKYDNGTDPIYDNPTLRIGQEIIFNQADL